MSPDIEHIRGDAGFRVSGVWLTYPDRPLGSVVAFASVRVDDGRGFGFTVSDVRLLWDEGFGKYWVQMPNEPKREACPHLTHGRPCGCKNPTKANYCNACGGPLVPSHRHAFTDLVAPLNTATRDMLLAALIERHEQTVRRFTDQPGGPASGVTPGPSVPPCSAPSGAQAAYPPPAVAVNDRAG